MTTRETPRLCQRGDGVSQPFTRLWITCPEVWTTPSFWGQLARFYQQIVYVQLFWRGLLWMTLGSVTGGEMDASGRVDRASELSTRLIRDGHREKWSYPHYPHPLILIRFLYLL